MRLSILVKDEATQRRNLVLEQTIRAAAAGAGRGMELDRRFEFRRRVNQRMVRVQGTNELQKQVPKRIACVAGDRRSSTM